MDDKQIIASLGVDGFWVGEGGYSKKDIAGGIIFQYAPPPCIDPKTDYVPTFMPSIYSYTGGLTFNHNMPCAVFPTEHAVYDAGLGVFVPSRMAESEGWRLVKNDCKVKELAYNFIYKGWYKTFATHASILIALGVSIWLLLPV